jgi:hypothetical protein
MAALVAAIHAFVSLRQRKTWMAGTSPAMTKGGPEAAGVRPLDCFAALAMTTPRLAAIAFELRHVPTSSSLRGGAADEAIQ